MLSWLKPERLPKHDICMRCHQEMVSKVNNMTVNIESELRLAFDEFALPLSLITEVLKEFRQQFPSTALLIVGCTHLMAYHLVTQNKADLAIAISKEDYPEDFHFRGIAHVHYGTIVSHEHPLAKLDRVSKEELSEYCHIRVTDLATGFRRLDSDLSTTIWFTDDYAMMLQLVREGFGWAELPLHVVEKELKNGTLKHIPTQHQTVTFPHSVDLIWPSDSKLGKANLWLIDALTRYGKRCV